MIFILSNISKVEHAKSKSFVKLQKLYKLFLLEMSVKFFVKVMNSLIFFL